MQTIADDKLSCIPIKIRNKIESSIDNPSHLYTKSFPFGGEGGGGHYQSCQNQIHLQNCHLILQLFHNAYNPHPPYHAVPLQLCLLITLKQMLVLQVSDKQNEIKTLLCLIIIMK